MSRSAEGSDWLSCRRVKTATGIARPCTWTTFWTLAMSLSAWRKLELTGRSEVESNSFIRRRLCQLSFLLRRVNKGRGAFCYITLLYVLLLSRRSRQRERLSASMLSVCLLVCLFVSLSVAKMQKTRFSQKLSNLELWCLLTTYRKSYVGFSKNPLSDS